MQFDIEHFKTLVQQELIANLEITQVEKQINKTEELLESLNYKLEELVRKNNKYMMTPSALYINEFYNFIKKEVENVQS